jgi:hypothetical protein
MSQRVEPLEHQAASVRVDAHDDAPLCHTHCPRPKGVACPLSSGSFKQMHRDAEVLVAALLARQPHLVKSVPQRHKSLVCVVAICVLEFYDRQQV